MTNLTKNGQIYFSDTKFEEKKRIISSKHFPRSTREWKNSVYLYNKNNLNLIPATDLSTIDIIKTYFYLFNKEIEYKTRTKRISLKHRRSSTHKTYVDSGEFKHTNNKVIINLYLFNKQRINYNIAIKKLKITYLTKLDYYKKLFLDRFYSLIDNNVSLQIIKLFLFKNSKKNKTFGITNKRINSYINKYFEKFLLERLDTEVKNMLLYWSYRQLIFINRSKYTYIYLQYLKQQLYKIYNKQIEFNLINLKKFYFSSDILSELVTKRISLNRKKFLIYMKICRNNVKVKNKNRYIHKIIKNNKLNNKKNMSGIVNKSNNSLAKFIIGNLKYKDVTGIKLQAKGRLTKRNTASRSILKQMKKGNLLNIDSSLKGLSTVLLKGNLKSNIQYSKVVSKSNIGSFGIKSWISSN